MVGYKSSTQKIISGCHGNQIGYHGNDRKIDDFLNVWNEHFFQQELILDIFSFLKLFFFWFYSL